MELYIIRHGETYWNHEHRIQGRSDVPLNENGRALAGKTGEALEQTPFDVIYSSPLIRAYETANLIRGPVTGDQFWYLRRRATSCAHRGSGFPVPLFL